MSREDQFSGKRFRSLAKRLPILFIGSFLLLVAVLLLIVYYRLEQRLLDEYTRMGNGLTALMAKELDGDKIGQYIKYNYEMDEYVQIVDSYYALMENYPDVLYLYVYRVKPDACTVIFDLNSEVGGEGDPPGYQYELDEAFRPYLEDLCLGREVPALSGNTADGYLLTCLRPVFDSRGNYQCYVCVDFSMDTLRRQDLRFVLDVLSFFLLGFVAILLLDGVLLRRMVTGPIVRMAECARSFRFETEEDRARNVEALRALDIKTGDEIEYLYRASLSVLQDSLHFIEHLVAARQDLQRKDEKISQISETAFRDPLTGVGNKAAYLNAMEALSREIDAGEAMFAVVMVDVNDLKYVNDTFGHKAGDNYIRGCCKLVCSCFKRSPVFRIGGDEFVAILKGEDFENRATRFQTLSDAFEEARGRTEKEPFERWSASIGMAVYAPGDESPEAVFKRADEAMYANKQAYKKLHGSYR